MAFLVLCGGLTGCGNANLFSWASNKDLECETDADCFVDAMFALVNEDHEKATAIANRIQDQEQRDYILVRAASVKTGGVDKVLESISGQDSFSLGNLVNACPKGTLTSEEIDILSNSGEVQYEYLSHLCRANLAKEDLGEAQKMVDALLKQIENLDEIDVGQDVPLSTEAAKDLCKEMGFGENCSQINAVDVQDYLVKNFN